MNFDIFPLSFAIHSENILNNAILIHRGKHEE